MMEALHSGDNVTASVRLVRPLAQGGMGTVWLAEHLVLDTQVAVKLMAREIEGHAGAAARFAREAAVAAAVKSPHVVQVFDSGVTPEGVAYIVMELLEGHDLGAHLTASGRMSPGEVAIVMGQLGKALAKAHRVGIVHRDLKPDNVFLCEVEGGEPFVKLLDFGTAKDETRAPNTTTLGQLIGTPYYMSPEQITGKLVDLRTDIWSLGVLAFEALTGARPFEGITVGAITLAIHTEAPRMTTVVPELPETLDAWFARACAHAPEDRFQSARAATDALTRAIAGQAAAPDSGTMHDELAVPSSSDGAALSSTMMMASAATPLTSTLLSPGHRERRTMMWLGSIALAAAIAIGVALVKMSDAGYAPLTAAPLEPVPATAALTSAAAPSSSSAPPAHAPVTASAIAPSSTASAPPPPVRPTAPATAAPRASGLPSLALPPPRDEPTPFPFVPASASAAPSARVPAAAPPKPEPAPAAPAPAPAAPPPIVVPAAPPDPASTLAPTPDTLPSD